MLCWLGSRLLRAQLGGDTNDEDGRATGDRETVRASWRTWHLSYNRNDELGVNWEMRMQVKGKSVPSKCKNPKASETNQAGWDSLGSPEVGEAIKKTQSTSP